MPQRYATLALQATGVPTGGESASVSSDDRKSSANEMRSSSLNLQSMGLDRLIVEEEGGRGLIKSVDCIQARYEKLLVDNPRLYAFLTILYSRRAIIFTTITVLSCIAVIGVAVTRGWKSFAGTPLFLALSLNGPNYTGYYSMTLLQLSNSIFVIFLIVLEVCISWVWPSGKAVTWTSADIIGRCHFVLAFLLPSTITIGVDQRNTELLAATYCGTIFLQNIFVVNGLLIIIGSKKNVSWNIAVYVLVSLIFASSCVLGTICEMQDSFNTDPNGLMVNAAQGLSYVQYIFVASALHYTHTLHSKGLLSVSLRHISLLPTGVLREFLFFALALCFNVSSSIAGSLLGSEASNRQTTISLLTVYTIIDVVFVSLLAVVPAAVQARQVLFDTSATVSALKSATSLRTNVVSLLREMMPKHVFESLIRGETPEPELNEFVTLIFCDVKGFTAFSDGRSPFEVLSFVQRLFTAMDEVCKSHESIYKVETVGDGYLAVGGLSMKAEGQAEQARLVEETAKFALEVMDAVSTVPMDESVPDSFVELRMGLHVGTIVTGITGKLAPRFCIFGDAVNTASRMESTGSPGMIHCSEAFARLLQVNETFHGIASQQRSITIKVKGKGEMNTFWVAKPTVDSFGIPLLQDGVHPSSVLSSFFRDEASESTTEPSHSNGSSFNIPNTKTIDSLV